MNKILQYAGLATRAGKAFGGGLQTETLIRSGKAKVLILAADASDNTKKKLINLADTHHVPVVETGDRESLGRATGKEYRSAVVLTDRGFADAVLRVGSSNAADGGKQIDGDKNQSS